MFQSIHCVLVTSFNLKVLLHLLKTVSSIKPGHLYLEADYKNYSLPPPHFGHRGITPNTLQSAIL